MAFKIEDFDNEQLIRSANRTRPWQTKLMERRKKIAAGQSSQLESDERRLAHTLRQAALAAEEQEREVQLFTPDFGLQAFIGPTDDILSSEFLEFGLLAAKSICLISNGAKTGTGFLIGKDLMITNNHVLPNPTSARNSIIEFNLVDNRTGKPENALAYGLDPAKFFAYDTDLDFTVVSVATMEDMPAISSFGWHPLFQRVGKILIGDPVNIIQHPEGETKKVVLHNSHFLLVADGTDADAFCWYSGDTKEGSSGSPVFNNRWEVVALHHSGIPKTNKNNEVLDINGKTMKKVRARKNPEDVAWLANEGSRVSRIVKCLNDINLDNAAMEEIRDALLASWQRPLALRQAQQAAQAD